MTKHETVDAHCPLRIVCFGHYDIRHSFVIWFSSFVIVLCINKFRG